MKVVRTGKFVFDGKSFTVMDWTFDCEGNFLNIDDMLVAVFECMRNKASPGYINNRLINPPVEEPPEIHIKLTVSLKKE